MNDEIKELLDRIDNYPEKLYCLNENEKHLLLDCITNLQQAFERSYTEEQVDFAVNEVKEQLKIEKQYSNQLCNEIDKLRVKNYELQQINNNQAKRNSRQRLANQKQQDLILNLQQENERLNIKYKSQKDINQKLLSIDIKHKKINGELREENSKLEIALQNIQEDYDRRVKEIDVLKKKLDRRYYKNECKRLEQENERLKKNQRLSPEERQHFHLDVDEIYEILIDYKSRCEKASEKLGNYKHYSTPTEEQNSENEDIVDSALNILQNGSDDSER